MFVLTGSGAGFAKFLEGFPKSELLTSQKKTITSPQLSSHFGTAKTASWSMYIYKPITSLSSLLSNLSHR